MVEDPAVAWLEEDFEIEWGLIEELEEDDTEITDQEQIYWAAVRWDRCPGIWRMRNGPVKGHLYDYFPMLDPVGVLTETDILDVMDLVNRTPYQPSIRFANEIRVLTLQERLHIAYSIRHTAGYREFTRRFLDGDGGVA